MELELVTCVAPDPKIRLLRSHNFARLPGGQANVGVIVGLRGGRRP